MASKDHTQPRLLCDAMLGRLAKWLRLLGYDTAYERDAPDNRLARRARAEGRVLLTRDHELARRRGLETLLIESEELEEQIQQVKDELGTSPGPMTRCSVCNVPLEEVAPDEVADRLPPYVLRTHDRFRRCPSCGRVYWAGSHIDSMNEQVDELDVNADA